mgnify:CR=1 FL=1
MRVRLERGGLAADLPVALAATQGAGELYGHPALGLWPGALREGLRQALALGLRKVVLWTDQHGTAEALFPSDHFDPFFNINMPEDFVKAEAMQ